MLRNTHTTQSHNLAARMGRWSAAHWKTATFGWLAFVLIAFGLGGMVGTRNIDNTAGPGESGRMDRILEAGFKQPAAEHVLIQSPYGSRRHARLRLRGRGRRRADLEGRGRPEHPLAAHPRQRGPHLEGRALRARRVPDPRRQGRGGRQDRPGPRRRCRRATRPSGLLDRRVRRRQRGEGGRDGVRQRPRQGGDALAPDHADRPRSHLRLARGGGYSAAARADRHLRDLRAHRGSRASCCRSPCRPTQWCS